MSTPTFGDKQRTHSLQHIALECEFSCPDSYNDAIEEVFKAVNQLIASSILEGKRPLSITGRVRDGVLRVHMMGLDVETPKKIAIRFLAGGAGQHIVEETKPC